MQDQENRLDPDNNLFGTDREIAFTQNDLIKQAIIKTDFTAPYFNQDGSIIESKESKKKNFIFNLKTLFASSIPVENNTIEKTILEQLDNEKSQITKQEIVYGKDEGTIESLRDYLTQYGGTNNITFVFGDDKKGLVHIVNKHGIEVLPKVIDVVVDGKITKAIPNKSFEIEKDGILAVLLLKEFNDMKNWLITGYDLSVKPDKNGKFYSTPNSTQSKTIFSRSDLGDMLNNINITKENKNINIYERSIYFIPQNQASKNLLQAELTRVISTYPRLEVLSINIEEEPNTYIINCSIRYMETSDFNIFLILDKK